MDGLAPPSYSPSPEIPTDIFEPLLKIAQLGYDVNQIRTYYLTMLRHLRRMGTENAEAAYTLVTPISDRKLPFSSSEDDSSSTYPTTESCEDHVSPKRVPSGWSWSRSASYEPSIQEQSDLVASQDLFNLSSEHLNQTHHMQLQIPEPTPTQQSFDRALASERSQAIMMSANYSPPAVSQPPLDINNINATTAGPVMFGHPTASASQWFGADDFPPPLQPQPQSQYIAPWPSMHGQPQYQMAMTNTQMPLLVHYPHAHPPAAPQRSFTESFADQLSNPWTNAGGLSQLATELYHSPFFPTIDVIPSRKRRKVLKSGVKRIAQSLGTAGSRQASV